jgi:hypothetical protein
MKTKSNWQATTQLLVVVALFAPSCVIGCHGQNTDAALRSFVDKQLSVAEGGGKICSVAQVDLSGNQTESILASIDWSGRGFCNDVWILRTGSNGSGKQRFDAWNVEDVRKLVVSLGSGRDKQLAVRRGYSQYNGVGCVATWTEIYTERNGKLEEESASFPAFYLQRLNMLQGLLNREEAEPECTQMEADKIRRFLGTSPTAGFDLAQRWVQSSNPALRAKGVAVFADIGDDPSKMELRKVAGGDAPEAILARHFLEADGVK